MTPTAHPSYRPEIDGLRAVAIPLVAVFHFRLLPLGDAGFIGVDIFFVISGYLITGLLMRDLDQGRMSLGRFHLARLRRLMPALLATLATLALYLLVAGRRGTVLSGLPAAAGAGLPDGARRWHCCRAGSAARSRA